MNSSSIDILLVEDNRHDEMLTMHALRNCQLAASVFIVRDGAEALDFLFCDGQFAKRPKVNPRMILLDRHLPLVNGLDVLRAIRANGRTKLIPVVMLTASGQQSDINESYQLRVNSYVIKPSDFDQFSEVVGHVARYWVTLNR